MTSGEAPGAATLSLAALAPVVIKVPITTPSDNVNKINVNESSFWLRALSKRLIVFGTPSHLLFCTYYKPATADQVSLKHPSFMDDVPARPVSIPPAEYLPK